MSDATRILQRIEQGDPKAAADLLPLVYEELRKLAAQKLAQEKPGQTLQATALVHEAYIRLVDVEKAQHWESRRHFFAAAAEAMRRILVDRARRKGRLKRGGKLQRQDAEYVEPTAEPPADEILDVDEALSDFTAKHPDMAEVVTLRYFAGLTIPEIAEILGVSSTTVDRHWSYARAWLYRRLKDTRI